MDDCGRDGDLLSTKMPTDVEKAGDKDKPFELKRHIGAFYGTCFVINMMVGSGIFAVPTGVLRYCNGDVIASLIVWGVGGIIAMLCALCVAELGSSIHQSGSWISFLRYIFGTFPSFVYAWVALTMSYPEGMAAQIAVLGEYITKVILDDSCEIPYLESAQKCFGITVFLIMVGVNITNIKLAIKIQVMFCRKLYVTTLQRRSGRDSRDHALPSAENLPYADL